MTVQTLSRQTFDPETAGAVQAFLPAEGECFALPQDITKAQAVRTAEAALRLLGAAPTEILVFRLIADTTKRAAWHSDTEAAVNFRRQSDMAREAGIGERQFRRVETGLQAYGVLARTTASNGYRGRRAGQAAAAGISLEPCIANYAAFTALLLEAAAREEARQEVRLAASMARHRLGRLVGATACPEARAGFAERMEAVDRQSRPPCPRTASHETLQAWLDAMLGLEREVRNAEAAAEGRGRTDVVLDGVPEDAGAVHEAAGGNIPAENPGSPPQENTPIQSDMSGAPDIDVRRHIQPTPESRSESCNPGGSWIHENGPGADAGAATSGAGSDVREDAVSKPLNAARTAQEGLLSPKMAARLTRATLRSLASDDAALYLDAFSDWRDAVPLILRDLGINAAAWLEAAEVMGHAAAFLALLVIDRNRFHPTAPVRSPGGTLRSFTRLAAEGRLSLTRSVNGIWERERAGLQPKGPAEAAAAGREEA